MLALLHALLAVCLFHLELFSSTDRRPLRGTVYEYDGRFTLLGLRG